MKLLKTHKIALALLVGAVSLQSCSDDDDTTVEPGIIVEEVALPEVITITNSPDLFPEGIDFNTTTNEFLVGSILGQGVGTIDSETGDYTQFITDENLVNVAGIFTDEERDRLIVASGDLTNGGSYVGIYNLTSGELIQGVELASEASFANDVAVDDEGNIYVTDSFSPFVYIIEEIDGAYVESVFVDGGESFTATDDERPGFGLNGIVYVDGYLIVNVLNRGTLFKIPVENPESFTQIDAPEFFGGDGLEVDAEGNLVIVENGFSTQAQGSGAYTLVSDDDFDSVTIGSVFQIERESFPTTAALASDGNIYVLNAYLTNSPILAEEGTVAPGQETFSILRAE